jgi:excisionase family DNA binding protein
MTDDLDGRPERDERGRDFRRTARPHDGFEEILTSREAQSLLKIGRTKLWELTRQNLVPAYRVGEGKSSSLRYKRSELLAWLERNRIPDGRTADGLDLDES